MKDWGWEKVGGLVKGLGVVWVKGREMGMELAGPMG